MNAATDTLLKSDNEANEVYLARQAMFESNARSYPRKLPLAIKAASGCWITDVEGNKYLDCLAGAGTLALGHNHSIVVQAIRKTLDDGVPLHTLDLTTPVKDAFSEACLKLLPGNSEDWRLQFCGPSGADAVEAAIKLAKTATGRSHVVSFSGGYHGMTHGALSLTGNLGPKTPIPNLMPGVQFLPYPYSYRCPVGLGGELGTKALSNYFERFIEDVESGVTKPAAVILEPIQGEGGVIPAPVAFLKKLREVTEKNGIVLILDEVQAGIGRTGQWFGFEEAEIVPDMVVISKAIGGGLPLALVGYRKVWDKWQPGAHTGTFRGNQLAMAAGTALINHMQAKHFLPDVIRKGTIFRYELLKLQDKFPCIGEVRGRGLMIGVEIVNHLAQPDALNSYPAYPELAAAIQSECFKNRLILEKGGRSGSVIRFLPPLIISSEEIVIAITRFAEAIAKAQAELSKEVIHEA